MQDLISRQSAIELVRDVCDAIMSGCESWYDPEIENEVYKDTREVDAILKCKKEVRIALRNMPSAQPERTGKWIHGRELAREMISDCIVAIRYDGWRCSECDYLVEQEREPLYKFCPNCGARMERRTDEPDDIFE